MHALMIMAGPGITESKVFPAKIIDIAQLSQNTWLRRSLSAEEEYCMTSSIESEITQSKTLDISIGTMGRCMVQKR